MTQGDLDIVHKVTTTVRPSSAGPDVPQDSATDQGGYKSYPTDIVAAVTIAVLAVVVILTLLLVIRALRKRRRARQGSRFGASQIQTVATGIMGTGGAAYAHTSASSTGRVPVRGAVSWESVNPATASGSQNDQAQSR